MEMLVYLNLYVNFYFVVIRDNLIKPLWFSVFSVVKNKHG